MDILVIGKKEFSKGYYYGELVDGKVCGQGTYYGEGFTYTGGFKNNTYDGAGKIEYPVRTDIMHYDNGSCDMAESYQGRWVNGLKQGRFIRMFGSLPYDRCFDKGQQYPYLFYDIPSGEALVP